MTKRGGYTVRIKRSVEKEMDRLPDKMFRRISEAILRLESDPRSPASAGGMPEPKAQACSSWTWRTCLPWRQACHPTANAIAVWIKDLPITPEKILKALQQKQILDEPTRP